MVERLWKGSSSSAAEDDLAPQRRSEPALAGSAQWWTYLEAELEGPGMRSAFSGYRRLPGGTIPTSTSSMPPFNPLPTGASGRRGRECRLRLRAVLGFCRYFAGVRQRRHTVPLRPGTRAIQQDPLRSSSTSPAPQPAAQVCCGAEYHMPRKEIPDPLHQT